MSVLENIYHCAACRDLYDCRESPYFMCGECGETFCSGCEEPEEEKRESKRCSCCHNDDVTDADCRKMLRYVLDEYADEIGCETEKGLRIVMRKKGLMMPHEESEDEEEEKKPPKSKVPPAPKPIIRSDDVEEEADDEKTNPQGKHNCLCYCHPGCPGYAEEQERKKLTRCNLVPASSDEEEEQPPASHKRKKRPPKPRPQMSAKQEAEIETLKKKHGVAPKPKKTKTGK